MKLFTESYRAGQAHLPAAGKHIVAQHDASHVWVYQAYKPSIAAFAARHGRFGGDEYSFNRMSWIKPNFLWMMYRSGWATKPGQEAILAIRIAKSHFEQILAGAVHSSFKPDVYPTHAAWQEALARSDVRLQWDPDHDPYGNKLERRAIQLGLRGEVLRQFATDWIVDIEDITPFLTGQRQYVETRELEKLVVPVESVYPVTDEGLAAQLRLQTAPFL
jgi:hypothetical protein